MKRNKHKRSFLPIPMNFNFDDFDDWEEHDYYMSLMRGGCQSWTPPDKKAHDFLRELCNSKNSFPSSSPQISPLTNRVICITNILNSIKVSYQLDVFSDSGYDVNDYNGAKLVNVVVEFKSANPEPAIVFSAHHDINNIHSDNAQDNTASCANLLYLCKILSKEPVINRRIVVVFTDREECGGVGARRFASQAKDKQYGEIAYNINLELTGLGEELWANTNSYSAKKDSKAGERLIEIMGAENINNVSCPFSDDVVFRGQGLDSICIGILPKEERNTHETWRLCHSNSDTFEKTNGEDMDNLCKILFQIVQGKDTVPYVAPVKEEEKNITKV